MKKTITILVCFILLVSFKATCQLTTSLEEYYKFDESSGQAVNSVNSSVNNSSSISATYGAAGRINTAFSFNGAADRVTFADHANWTINATSNLSISMWIYFSGDISNSYATLWGHQSGPMFYLTKVSSGNYQICWWAGNSESTTGTLTFTMSTWYHIVFVKSGSSLTFYRNGTSAGTATASDNNMDPTGVYIGGDTYTTPQAFYGRIDEVGIWKRVLSSAEVSQLYNSGSGLAYPFSAPVAPTVTTTAASSIAQTTATSGGNVTTDGGASVTARGVCWSTSANPTTSNSKTTNGTGTGSFTSSITGLTAGTTYHIRAYATNSAGTSYGSDLTFTTTTSPVVPAITTTAATSITQTTATSGGNVTADGGASVTARGVCWSTSANPTTSNSKTNNGTGTGSFTSSITGLTAGTTYHIRAYATNSVGTAYGSDLTFTTATNPVIPTVTTTAATSIAQTTATSGGNVTTDGGASVTARGICWSTSANPTTALTTKTSDGTGTGAFTSSITGLTANTTYHIRAYATNSVGTSYGSDLTFTTTASGSAVWQNSGANIYFSTGNVGIGTANPTQHLTVNGKILAKEVEVVSSIASDYVFDQGYELMPLTELERYLKQNRHLPGVLSAAEFEKKGQNLGEMDDLLLRKIEELTLYIINQQKTIELLKEEINRLKCLSPNN